MVLALLGCYWHSSIKSLRDFVPAGQTRLGVHLALGKASQIFNLSGSLLAFRFLSSLKSQLHIIMGHLGKP